MSSPHQTRASLLVRVRDPHDGAAWLEFDHRYGGLIAAYCRARSLQPADAEDVRQLVMMKLAQTMRRFEYQPELGKFRHYLRRVVHGELVRYLECHKTSAFRVGLGSGEERVPDLDDELQQQWEQEWIRHHFRVAWETVRLSSDAKSLEVFLQLLSGASITTTAAAFAMTEEAVRKVKQRMGERLKAAIAAQVLDEDAT